MSKRLICGAALMLAVWAGSATVSTAQTTVSFQPGTDGYDGLLDLFIGLGQFSAGGPDSNVMGSEVQQNFMDGGCNIPDSDDTQGLFRFDDILDSIPANSKIVSASLEFTTAEIPNAQSGGPYGVARLLVPFDETTTYNSAGGGFRVEDGELDRPLPNGFVALGAGLFASADVTEIVQAWVDGETNHGFCVYAGTTDGWAVLTSGFTDGPASLRPRLTVTFMDAPKEPATAMAVYTQSPMDSSNRMFVVDGFNDTFVDTDTISGEGVFLDGDPADGDPNLQALIRFDNIFASQGGLVPDDAEIVNASLTTTTATCFFSTNSNTDEEIGVRQILTDFDGTGSFADLSFGPVVDIEFGLIENSQAVFDVTSIVEAFQSGASNFGFNLEIQPTLGGTNGWALLPSSSTIAPPALKVTWLSDKVLLGDINCDGIVSLLDVAPFVSLISSGGFSPKADINQDGAVNLLDVAPFVSLLSGG